MWHFLADPHIGHANIIKYCKRPFMSRDEEGLLTLADKGIIPNKEVRISAESTNRMNDTIFNSINSQVAKKDKLVIGGDFCFLPRDNKFAFAKRCRDRINCETVYLICGNHDDRQLLSPLFTGVYDQYSWNIDGQEVFTNHYPCREWDQSHKGAWMLYGHVHNLLTREDEGGLLPYEEAVFSAGFLRILDKYGIPTDLRNEVVRDLLEVAASINGIDMTLDIGIDNVREGKAFGTPWSMPDLYEHMAKKQNRWNQRRDAINALKLPR